MPETYLPVVFRRWPDSGGGDVIALFPTLKHGGVWPEAVTSYQHMGQHGAADYDHVVSATRPATEAEYAPLLLELQRIGYAFLEVCARRPAHPSDRGRRVSA